MIAPRVDVDPGRTCHETEGTMVDCGRLVQNSRSFKTIAQECVCAANLDNLLEIGHGCPDSAGTSMLVGRSNATPPGTSARAAAVNR